MAAKLFSRLQDTSFNELGSEDRLGLLVTAEWNRRQTNTIKRLIHNACWPPLRCSGRNRLLRGQKTRQGTDAALLHLQIY